MSNGVLVSRQAVVAQPWLEPLVEGCLRGVGCGAVAAFPARLGPEGPLRPLSGGVGLPAAVLAGGSEHGEAGEVDRGGEQGEVG